MADYLKIPDIARRLDVSEPTARRMVKGGKLPSVFIGGAYRVNEEDLEAYIENARVQPRPKVEARPEPEVQERREPEAHTGEAHLKGTGTLDVGEGVLIIGREGLERIFKAMERRELSANEAMGEVEKAEIRQ